MSIWSIHNPLQCRADALSTSSPPLAWVGLALVLLLTGCSEHSGTARLDEIQQQGETLDSETPYAAERREMVRTQLVPRGIKDPLVLAAMGRVPRHEFVPMHLRGRAYRDGPLPIGEQQTISQPLIVALMTELSRIHAGSRVLEIGTGSGYQAAILHEITEEVYSIEIVEALAARARETLGRLGHGSVHLRHGDGYRGWPEAAPFDAILVTAAPPTVPQPLLDQLREGGRLVVPVGTVVQELEVYTKTSEGIVREPGIKVLFVPMTGEIQELP